MILELIFSPFAEENNVVDNLDKAIYVELIKINFASVIMEI